MKFEYPRDFIPTDYDDIVYHRETHELWQIGSGGDLTLVTDEEGNPFIWD